MDDEEVSARPPSDPSCPHRTLAEARTGAKAFQPVIMGDHNNIVISREAFAIVGKEIMPAATGKPTAVHVNHDRAFMAAVDLGCPKIQAQAVFAG
jgi:hypothetical protein